jgi:hypothetical protein
MRVFAALSLTLAVVPAHAEEQATALCQLASTAPGIAALKGRGPVPRNLALVVERTRVESIVARDEDGADTALAGAALGPLTRFSPKQALPSSTTLSLFCLPAGAEPGDENACGEIVTGTDVDETAPAEPTVAALPPKGDFALDPECGGAVNATEAGFDLTDLGDDVSAAILRRTLNGTTTIVDARLHTNAGADLFVADFAQEGGDASYAVTVVDDAGNESAPTIVPESLGCPGSCAQADGATFGALMALLIYVGKRKRPSSEVNASAALIKASSVEARKAATSTRLPSRFKRCTRGTKSPSPEQSTTTSSAAMLSRISMAMPMSQSALRLPSLRTLGRFSRIS